MLTAHLRAGRDDWVRTFAGAGIEPDVLVLAGSRHAHAGTGSERWCCALSPVRDVPQCWWYQVLVQDRPEAIRGEYGAITAVIGRRDDTGVLGNVTILGGSEARNCPMPRLTSARTSTLTAVNPTNRRSQCCSAICCWEACTPGWS